MSSPKRLTADPAPSSFADEPFKNKGNLSKTKDESNWVLST